MLSRSIALSLVLWLVACGGAGGAPTETAHDEAPIACGITFGATHEHRCAEELATCTVAEGSCVCQHTQIYAPHCGGAAYESHPQEGPLAWQCTPRDPSVDRGDGCPYAPPMQGTVCPRPELSCTYGGDDGCGNFAGAVATCGPSGWVLVVSLPVPYP